MTKAAIKYVVKLDPATGRWDITRDGKPTGGFAREMNTAIGLASADASREARAGGEKISAWLDYGGTKKKVWPT